jgi:hypothetical protein
MDENGIEASEGESAAPSGDTGSSGNSRHLSEDDFMI